MVASFQPFRMEPVLSLCLLLRKRVSVRAPASFFFLSLKLFCLQATAQLYEQGGLNHDMSFFLTAVAFYSMERPDVKVRNPFREIVAALYVAAATIVGSIAGTLTVWLSRWACCSYEQAHAPR